MQPANYIPAGPCSLGRKRSKNPSGLTSDYPSGLVSSEVQRGGDRMNLWDKASVEEQAALVGCIKDEALTAWAEAGEGDMIWLQRIIQASGELHALLLMWRDLRGGRADKGQEGSQRV